MTVYLIHFEQPHCHAQHYVGWTVNLGRRIQHHRNGTGARLLAVQKQRGNRWVVARTWPGGDRTLERQIKRGKHTRRLCPVCRLHLKVCYSCGKMYKTDRWFNWHTNHAHKDTQCAA